MRALLLRLQAKVEESGSQSVDTFLVATELCVLQLRQDELSKDELSKLLKAIAGAMLGDQLISAMQQVGSSSTFLVRAPYLAISLCITYLELVMRQAAQRPKKI